MISSPLITAVEVISLVGEAVFLDARVGPDATRAYETAHVSGAIHVDLETDLSEVGDPASGGRHPLPSLDVWLARLGAWGISPATPVIVYDGAGGGMAAARAWWMLRAIGHEPLAVVDGGWQALRDAGVPTESGDASASPVGSYPRKVDRWPVVNAALVERVRTDPSWRVIDARAPERFTGQWEPLDPAGGHIPGAHNLYWQSQLDNDGVLESCTTLRERYALILGSVSSERVVCYCGSGVTACHLLLAMEACGLSGAQLYVGSWSEWCRQGHPRAAG
ncbi:MAG: sulfurtransferase [Deltaproteobacteria bacterium]|nr:MAG: sulfurtransferase [Deltaproteobacteria bacterium]